MFKEQDKVEYTPEFKQELLEADYALNAINRKFIYTGSERAMITNEPIAVLRCLTHHITVKVSFDHLTLSK